MEGKAAKLDSKPPVNNSAKKDAPFDFNFIKVLIKKSSDKEATEVLLERAWVSKRNNIPHFANVIRNVDPKEGVEITMNCNRKAFSWIIDYVKIKTNGEDELDRISSEFVKGLTKQQKETILDETKDKMKDMFKQVNVDNCLNILVTAYFLQLYWVYEQVWEAFFIENFAEVINKCSISLTNLNPVIVRHIAERIPDSAMEFLNDDRKDKFISNVYKAKIDFEILAVNGPETASQY